RLYRALVEDQHIAIGASSGSNTDGIGGGSASLAATPAEGVSLEQLETAMDAVVAQYLRDGPTDAELARAKSQLEAAAVYARDSQYSLAYIYGSSLAEGQSIDEIVTWPHKVEAVTRDDVIAIMRETFDTDKSVTGYLLPASGSTTATGNAPPPQNDTGAVH
ncbi:MAG: insulinase family protein, partial [Pseudomonadota bacterium]